MLLHLPAEVLLLVCDQISDLDTLRAVRLACSSLDQLAAPLVWSTLTFDWQLDFDRVMTKESDLDIEMKSNEFGMRFDNYNADKLMQYFDHERGISKIRMIRTLKLRMSSTDLWSCVYSSLRGTDEIYMLMEHLLPKYATGIKRLDVLVQGNLSSDSVYRSIFKCYSDAVCMSLSVSSICHMNSLRPDVAETFLNLRDLTLVLKQRDLSHCCIPPSTQKLQMHFRLPPDELDIDSQEMSNFLSKLTRLRSLTLNGQCRIMVTSKRDWLPDSVFQLFVNTGCLISRDSVLPHVRFYGAWAASVDNTSSITSHTLPAAEILVIKFKTRPWPVDIPNCVQHLQLLDFSSSLWGDQLDKLPKKLDLLVLQSPGTITANHLNALSKVKSRGLELSMESVTGSVTLTRVLTFLAAQTNIQSLYLSRTIKTSQMSQLIDSALRSGIMIYRELTGMNMMGQERYVVDVNHFRLRRK